MSFVASTPLVSTFYHTIEALCTMLNDVVLSVDGDGIHVGQFDAKNTCLVNVTFVAAKFEAFEVSKPHRVSLNLQCLFKVLKTIKNAKDITIAQTGAATTLEIRAKLADRTVIHKLSTLEIDQNYVPLPTKSFDVIARMSSALLFATVRSMSHVAEVVELYASQAGSPRQQFEMRAKGSFSNQYVLFEPNENFALLQHRNCTAFLGKFNVKTAAKYAKGVNLSKTVTLQVSRDLPLNLVYESKLGSVSFCIAAE